MKLATHISSVSSTPTIASVLLVLLIALSGFGFRECGGGGGQSSNTPQTPEQQAETAVDGTVKGVRIVSSVIDAGIGTARALREAGKIKPDKSLKLARGAKLVNSATRDLANFLRSEDSVDARGRVQIQSLINAIFDDAQKFEDEQRREGMTKSDNATLIFDLGISNGRLAAGLAFDEFGANLPEGFLLPVSAAQKERLRAYLKTLDRNEQRLDEAIARLSH